MPSLWKGIAAKSLCFLLSFSLSLFLIVCLHGCVLLSLVFLFILYCCLYVSAYITLWLFYKLLFLFYYNFFLILCHFFNSGMLCFVFISVIPTSCIFIANGSYLIIFQYEVSLQQTINQQTTSMKPNTSRMN